MTPVEAPFMLYGGELLQAATVAKFATVQIDGGREPTVSKMEIVEAEGGQSEPTTTEDFSVVQSNGGVDRMPKQMQWLADKTVTAKKAGGKNKAEPAAGVAEPAKGKPESKARGKKK